MDKKREIAIENYSGISVKAGMVIPVYNRNRKKFSNAHKVYNAIWVEDHDGSNERCLLFTDHELKCSRIGILGWNTVPGRLYRVEEGGQTYYFVQLEEPISKEKYIVKMSSTNLKNGEYRAYRNPEDITKKSFWVDLLD